MLKVMYPFDGENPNEALEDVVVDFLEEQDYGLCGDDTHENDDGTVLRVLEFESGKADDEMNAHEKGFVNDASQQEMLQDIIGKSIVLKFDFEPWDEDDDGGDEEEAPAPAPVSDKKIMYFGWCNKTDSKGVHDKVWGVISAQREWITFWGGRNKKLTFKKADDYSSGDSLEKLIRSKQRKGYDPTTMEEMNRLDPQFETRFEEELILAMMADKFHHA